MLYSYFATTNAPFIAFQCHYDANFRWKMADAVSLYLDADAEIRAQSSRGSSRLKRSASDESSDTWQQGPNSMGTSFVMIDYNAGFAVVTVLTGQPVSIFEPVPKL